MRIFAIVLVLLFAQTGRLSAADYVFPSPRTAYVLNLTASGVIAVSRATGVQTLVPYGERMTFAGYPKYSKPSIAIFKNVRAHIDSYVEWPLIADAPVDVLVTGPYHTYGPGGWENGSPLVSDPPRFPDRVGKVVLAYVNATEFGAGGKWDPGFNGTWDRDGDLVIDANVTNLPDYVDRAVFNEPWKTYVARYWTESWRQQLAKKIDYAALSHFDGVMLDVMTAYWTWRSAYPTSNLAELRARLADLFRWASQYAKTRHGSSFVVAANIDPAALEYFPDLGAILDGGYYQNLFFEWNGSGLVNGPGRSTRSDVFSNPIVDFTRSQGLTLMSLDHLGTGIVGPGLNFPNYNDRVTDVALYPFVRWAMQSTAVPQLSPVFFGMPYAMTPRFARVRPGVASFAETPYRDWVLGSAAGDVIATGAGDDLAVGGAGNDVIDGGSGTNTALFLGRRHEFAVSRSGSAVIVTDTIGGEGSDTLINIQFLQFVDERVSVNEGLPPTTLMVTLEPPEVSGQSVSLRWRASGGIVAEYILEAGTASGLRDLYIASLGASTAISAVAPAGDYFVRIRVRTTSGLEVFSNEVSFSIGKATGCSAPPPAPAIVAAVAGNNVATLTWAVVAGATSYVVQAGTASGASDLFHGNVGANVTVSAAVGAGFRAYVRVLAANACGMSLPSAERLLQ